MNSDPAELTADRVDRYITAMARTLGKIPRWNFWTRLFLRQAIRDAKILRGELAHQEELAKLTSTSSK